MNEAEGEPAHANPIGLALQFGERSPELSGAGQQLADLLPVTRVRVDFAASVQRQTERTHRVLLTRPQKRIAIDRY